MSNVSEVKEVLSQHSRKKLITVAEGDYEALQAQAKKFIEAVQQTAKKRQIMASKGKLVEAIQYVKNEMNNSRNFTAEIVNAQHVFDMNISAFLGRTIYLTYVQKNGSLSFFNEVNMGKLYNKYITKGKGVGKFQTALPEDWSDLEKTLNDRIQASAAKKAWTYTEAIRRWEKNNSDDKKKRMHYRDSYRTFYWRLYTAHHVSGWTTKINTRGHIAEAYAGCVINEDESINADKNDWALLSLYNKIRNDSTSGIKEGDVQLNADGSIHFAIKSGSFQTPGSSQYIKLAYNILQIPSLTTKEFEENLSTLLNLDSVSEAFVEAVRQKAEEEAKQVAEDAVKT